MDVDLIKKKLEKFQQKPKKFEKIDYEKIFWSPSVGKQTIRVVPSKFNSKNPFMEAYFYYGIGSKVMISPATFGEDDPIKQFVLKLKKTNEKENWSLAKKLEAKLRIFAPVIVRGEEEKGVRWWQFGKTMYLDFLSMADDEDIGDFTDIHEGRDFTVDTVGPEVTGTSYNKSSIRPKTKLTPLSDNPDKVKLWMENQPNPLDVYKRFTFDEMKNNLQNWLEPETEEEGSISSESPEPFDDEPKEEVKPRIPKPIPQKQSKVSEFNALFGENNDNSDNVDDLPF